MPLIIEDGSLPAGANSYVTVAEVRAYAEARALTLPAADTDIEPACVLSSDYIRGIEYKFQGSRVSIDQALTWPRYPVTSYGFEVGSDEIPEPLKEACCQLATESTEGTDFLPTTDGRLTTKEKVGELEVNYSESSDTDGTINLQAVEALLLPLFNEQYQGGGVQLRTQRV